MKIKKANKKKTNKICKKYFGNCIETGIMKCIDIAILYYPGAKTC